jgi:prolipoprotein diacylglyceryltransferase
MTQSAASATRAPLGAGKPASEEFECSPARSSDQPLYVFNAFGILAVGAILAGWRLTRRYAGHLQLDPEAASRFARLLVLGGAAGAALSRFHSIGAFIGAACAGLLYLKLTRRPLRYFDAAALAFPPSWLLFRAGCAIVHDHPGAFSTSPLAWQFAGGRRWDLGLLELLATIPLAAAFFLLGRRKPAPGLPSGTLALAYGAIRVVVAQFSGDKTYVAGFGAFAIAIGAVILCTFLRGRAWSLARRFF